MRKQLFATAAGLAVAAAFGVGAAAQTAPPPATPPQTTSPAQPAPQRGEAQQVTLVGCVQREADYRQANNLGKGGAVGTGVGASNEFVLINATASGATGSPSATGAATGTPAGTATGTSGGTAAGQAFEVSGANESQLAQYVGQRVEITGTLKKAEVGPAGATGGTTAGKPPTGVDVTSADLRLREVEIVSVKTASGTCPTK